MKIKNAEITWLDSGLPYSTQFEDIYFSEEDELAESQHVFLKANGLSDRWRHAGRADAFHIGELGFGCGLNFLQTCKLWRDSTQRPARLHYIAFEKHPLTLEHLERAQRCWPALVEHSVALLAQYTGHSAGCHRLQFDEGITLDLYFGDAHEQLERRMIDACPAIQCWFLDGFSPASNEQLWEESLMRLIAASSDETTTLSSYSVAGKVRNAVANAGFEVEKIEGFGRKRHSLFARMSANGRNAIGQQRDKAPWFKLPNNRPQVRTVAVIGAGLAGCSTAYSLARRGCKVIVFDAARAPAAGASGISRLALRCRLFNSHSPAAEFYLQAYLFALRQFDLLARSGKLEWETCGVLQLIDAMNKRVPLQRETLDRIYSEELMQFLDAADASGKAGMAVRDAAWHFPDGGAIGAASLCGRYLGHPDIQVVLDTSITALEQSAEKWELRTENADAAVADAVVIANSHCAINFSQCAELPLQISRGQSTEIASSGHSESLLPIVSGARSIFPAANGRHTLSASYADSAELHVSPADTAENISRAGENFTEPDLLGNEVLSEKVALRCNTPDHAPILGMVPDAERMRSSYAELSRNAKAVINTPGHYLSNLYINVAHGSNGVASCPLGAEFLASLIMRENLPLSRDMVNGLSATRFLINDLKKQRA